MLLLGIVLLLAICGSTCEEEDDKFDTCDRDCTKKNFPYSMECLHQYWNCMIEHPDDFDPICYRKRDRCYEEANAISFSCYSKCKSCYYEFYNCVDDCGGSSDECGEAYEACIYNLDDCVKDWYPSDCLSDCGEKYYICEEDYYKNTEEPNFNRLHQCVDEWEDCLLGCF